MRQKIILALASILLLNCIVVSGSITPYNLRCEGASDPLDIENPVPRLSWLLENDFSGMVHDAWQVQAASSKEKLLAGRADLWDSKWQPYGSPERFYKGKALKSYDLCYWRVRTRTEDGQVSPWSDPGTWRMGVLTGTDWQGRWIGYSEMLPGIKPGPTARDLNLRFVRWIWTEEKEDDFIQKVQHRQRRLGPRYVFSKEFKCPPGKLEWAVLRLAIDGKSTRVYINDRLVDLVTTAGVGGADSWATPVDLDLAGYLNPGVNRIEVSIERIGGTADRVFGFQAVLAMKDQAGKVQRLSTDLSWRAAHVLSGEIRETKPTSNRILSFSRNHEFTWGQEKASPILRRDFMVNPKVKSAILSVSGLGFYELNLNGKRVGDRMLDPAFTNYNKRVFYSTYDLTEDLQKGKNTLGLILGNGWYNQVNYDLFDFDIASWRDDPKALLQLRIEYDNGKTEWVVSDGQWKASRSPVVYDGIRNGQVYDARLEQPGWDCPGFDDSGWKHAILMEAPKGRLASTNMPPERVIEVLEAEEISETPYHSFIFKFPRNTTGSPRLKVSGPRGTRVVMRCFEVFDDRNTSWVNIQGPFQTDTYILKGEGEELFEPGFTYHGFQYIELTGYPGEPKKESLTAAVVHTDFEQQGSFECSSELLNAIQDMTLNSYLTNYHGLPLDCPTREKHGWTADGYLAAETGLLNFNAYTAHSKWVDDMLDCQHEDGRVPDIVPTDSWGYNGYFDWDCAIIYMPWYDYLYTGNKEILARSYKGMKACYEYYYAKAKNGILDAGRGDHGSNHISHTPTPVTITAILSDCARIISEIAVLLDNEADQADYRQKSEIVREAFIREFIAENGTVANGTMTAQSCALFYDLVLTEQRPAVLAKLVEAVHRADDHVDFGIFGAKYVFSMLSENGYHDLACTIALQDTYPGYGWWVKKGLTTQAENWDCTTDFNHIMFGDISAWFYRQLAGIKPLADAPGFKRFILQPRVDDRLSFVKAEHQSTYGLISSRWIKEGDTVEYHFEVPVNTEARVILEGDLIEGYDIHKRRLISHGKVIMADNKMPREKIPDKYEITVGAGRYSFKMRY